jgi:hypothetical protein
MPTLSAATQLTNDSMLMSRRSLMRSFAVAAPAVLMLTSTRAQGDVLREYRPADQSFRIEFPGEPKVEAEAEEFRYKHEDWIKSIEASLNYEDALLSVDWKQYKNNRSVEFEFGRVRMGLEMVAGGTPVSREEPLVMNGFPARNFICQSDRLNSINRLVVMGKETINVSAIGDDSIHRSAVVQRFFDSFKLLRSTP